VRLPGILGGLPEFKLQAYHNGNGKDGDKGDTGVATFVAP
jgi:hypothetical protein